MTSTHRMEIPGRPHRSYRNRNPERVGPLRGGWLFQGPKVRAFENAWSAFTGAEHSIAVTSCTTALHLSLAALGFGPGDEAIVPAFTWISTANVVEHLGGRWCLPTSTWRPFNINAANIEALITPRTKVILPVHLFGLAAEMDAINAMASAMTSGLLRMQLVVSVPLFRSSMWGIFGNTGCFSFHPARRLRLVKVA